MSNSETAAIAICHRQYVSDFNVSTTGGTLDTWDLRGLHEEPPRADVSSQQMMSQPLSGPMALAPCTSCGNCGKVNFPFTRPPADDASKEVGPQRRDCRLAKGSDHSTRRPAGS